MSIGCTLDRSAENASCADSGILPRVVNLCQPVGFEVNKFMADAAHFNDAGALALAKSFARSVR